MHSESVSQNRYVPPASRTHRSSIASNKRPPAVISAAIGGKYHRPCRSTTASGGVSNDVFPECTWTLTGFACASGVTSTNNP